MENISKHRLRNIVLTHFPGTVFDILTPPNPKMGDYSINLAFVLAKERKQNSIEIGKELVRQFSEDKELKKYFSKIELAGAGFVNFYLSEDYLRKQLVEILDKKDKFGSQKKYPPEADQPTAGKFKVNLEFVSANPTGPLTVANVRAASFGDTLANILKKSGYEVTKEYYINDAGNQVRLLGESVARRYIRLKGKTIEFPDNLYQGEYITDIAKEINEKNIVTEDENFDKLVITCKDYAIDKLLASAKKSMADLGVSFNNWFSEKKLYEGGEVDDALKALEDGKYVSEKDGAKWLKIDDSGEHDAVIVKSDGSNSYLMADIAYTRNKFNRGFDKAINIWGSDHHGDVLRLKVGVKALGYEEDRLEILLHQLVFIKSQGELQRMSKRKGEFVLLDDLLKEVGKDVIRFFFLMKDLNTHMEFDIDLAKEQSKKNPVFYIQYAYARLNQIFTKAGIKYQVLSITDKEAGLLKEKEELILIRKMARFPELIEDIAQNYQVHHLAQYTLELASDFHNFYEKCHVIQDDKELQKARVKLCRATAIVIEESLGLMGISAPKKMKSTER